MHQNDKQIKTMANQRKGAKFEINNFNRKLNFIY